MALPMQMLLNLVTIFRSALGSLSQAQSRYACQRFETEQLAFKSGVKPPHSRKHKSIRNIRENS
jgi:hypothetical protein